MIFTKNTNLKLGCMKYSVLISRVALVLILLMLSFLRVSSQNQKIDSLRSLLSKTKGTEHMDVLFELARSHDEDERSFMYAKEAFAEARNIGDTLRIVQTGRLKSQMFLRLGKLDSSI